MWALPHHFGFLSCACLCSCPRSPVESGQLWSRESPASAPFLCLTVQSKFKLCSFLCHSSWALLQSHGNTLHPVGPAGWLWPAKRPLLPQAVVTEPKGSLEKRGWSQFQKLPLFLFMISIFLLLGQLEGTGRCGYQCWHVPGAGCGILVWLFPNCCAGSCWGARMALCAILARATQGNGGDWREAIYSSSIASGINGLFGCTTLNMWGLVSSLCKASCMLVRQSLKSRKRHVTGLISLLLLYSMNWGIRQL